MQDRCRGLTHLTDHSDGVNIKRIFDLVDNLGRFVFIVRRRRDQVAFVVVGPGLLTAEIDHFGDFGFGDEGAMDAHQAGAARGQEQHVALAEQVLGAHHVQNSSGIDSCGHTERDASREVGLDEAGDDIDRRPLGSQNEVDADGAGHLGEADDAGFDTLTFEHHQVGQLVDDDQDVRQRLLFFEDRLVGFGEERERFFLQLPNLLIELVDVADAVRGQQLNTTIVAQTRMQTAEEFANILLRVNPDGSQVRLRDIARIEVGAERYEFVVRYNGRPAAGLGIKLATGANALDTADAVKAKIAELSVFFPQGLEYIYPYDSTPYVKLSIDGVVETLVEAIVLVFLVMLLFLQNIRATLIPTIAVPVVLLGTFGVLAASGFSINTLTMFGMVLAIGLLVDDAIVVVENVERVMHEEGLSPREATRKSMGQITGALIGIALVLSAVFVPMAFFGGSTGVIYRQFSITIVSAMALSVLVAIVFTPALCATMLKPIEKGHEHGEGSWFGGFFHWFNGVFNRNTGRYESAVGKILARSVRFLAIYVAIVGVLVLLFFRMPTSFLPEEDQGVMFTQIILPAGATQERTIEVLKKVEHQYLENEKGNVRSVFAAAGFSFAGQGQNMGIGFVNLEPWDKRGKPGQDVKSIAGRAMGAFSQIKEAMVFAFVPPAVLELGTSSGFNVQLQDRAGLGHDALIAARNQFLGMAAQDKRLVGVRPNGQEDVPEYQLDIDHAKAGALGVSVEDINDTLGAAWGGIYVNDFIDRGRIKKVYLQADADARMKPEDLAKWYVRNRQGEMVPLSAFTTGHWVYGSPRLERYNGQPSVELLGQAAPGLSSGDAMAAVEEIIAKLPTGIGYEWTGTSFEERRSGTQAPALYALSLLVVFLCLAALYESWSVPFAVILVVPLGVFGALLAASGRGLSNDVYFQVALLATIGLSSKNAILIVEFAKEQMEREGKDLVSATLEAVRMRLRPILMTSLAFGFGVLPLAIANGAGSGAQNAVGTGVLGGTIAGTLLGIFFIPLFYVVIKRIFGSKQQAEGAAPTVAPQEVK